jgi:4-hydroxymandelate oxidase
MIELEFHRRAFFTFLASSAVLAPPLRALASEIVENPSDSYLIKTLEEALQVTDFEAPARRAVPPAHWGYLASGSEDNRTLKANTDGFLRWGLRPRVLSGVSTVDTSIEVFGEKWETPLFLCPVSSQNAFHPAGVKASAAAAKAKGHQLILSSFSSTPLTDVKATLGAPPWQQLYLPQKWDDTVRLVKSVEDAGVSVLVWTVDTIAGRNSPSTRRSFRSDSRDCKSCHTNGAGTFIPGSRPFYEELGIPTRTSQADTSWKTLERLIGLTKMKVVLKGIETAEDAQFAIERGVDGLIVSNHGGRAMETERGTIECLGEVVEATNGKVPVFLDGGIRRGSDIYKAIALGAKGVGIGRPYLWALAAFGQPGVEKVLDILRAEFLLTMRQTGTPNVSAISSNALVRLVPNN